MSNNDMTVVSTLAPSASIDYESLVSTSIENHVQKEVLPQPFHFEQPGDQILGKLVEIMRDIPGESDSHFNVYIFDTSRGLISCTLGAIVDTKVALMNLEHVFMIEFCGQVKTRKGYSMNTFRIADLGLYDDLMKLRKVKKLEVK